MIKVIRLVLSIRLVAAVLAFECVAIPTVWGVAESTSLDTSAVEPVETSRRLVPGQSFTRTAEGETKVTYHVYVPKAYDAEAPPRPLLITFSPAGDGKALLEKLKDGVEPSGWLLVGCDQLKNGMHDRALELKTEDEVLDDVLATLPHDPQRVYLGGFSGGAMRAYDLTTRRSERFAGIVAYGGWLGGPDYQDEPYREGMSVAMANGLNDRGANGWMPIDTATLRKRDCTVKHFAFEGAHSVAPPKVTEMAVAWLESQWNRKPSADAASGTAQGSKIPLGILYVGPEGERANDFSEFLTRHFVSVDRIDANSLTLEAANKADVLLLDTVVRSLPEGCTKAMLMTGSSAAMTAERYGSKIDWLCQCLDNEAYLVDTAHPVFSGPLPVTPTLVEKRCPHSQLKIQAWKVEEPQETPGLVSSRKHFQSAKDSEIISGGVNMKGISGVPLVREVHRLLWGFVAPPKQMTEEGRRVFVNCLVWIHQFDGHQQAIFAGTHGRDTIRGVLESPYTEKRNLIRWFPQELLDQTGCDKQKLVQHFEGRMPYVFVPTGSGQLQVDRDAEHLKTPNNDANSLETWVELLGSGSEHEAAIARRLLLRYTGQRFRKTKQWQAWLDKNGTHLSFYDKRGYRFYAGTAEPSFTTDALLYPDRADTPVPELTEISPVLFDRKLISPHQVDGVAYQYKGWKVTLEIRARVKEGWHFYSATEDDGTNKPTKIQVELPKGMEFVGDWDCPVAIDGELSDRATFKRVISVGKELQDLATIRGQIGFQACTESKCLPPQKLSFELPLTVMAR